ncbi:MAG: hypothetical protein NTX50_32025 [Candidatus Sumerlaeota bacterium]|nr:hypothetical protein [Candidatus Sumerlaeota bacterium]
MIVGLSIHFSNNWSLWAVLLATVVLSVICILWTRRAMQEVAKHWRGVLFALRWLSLLLLLGFIANPVLSYRAYWTKKGGVAILLDTSHSMSIKDSVGGASRFDASKSFLLDSQKDFIKRIAEHNDPYTYVFDRACAPTTVERLKDLAQPQGAETHLAAALQAIARQRQPQNLTSVVMITDGQDNGSDNPQDVARSLGLPIYAIGVGKQEGQDKPPDRRVVAARANPIAVRGADSIVRVTLQHDGFAGEVVNLQLTDEGKAIASQQVALSDTPSQEVPLTFKPQIKGQRTYQVSIPHNARDTREANDQLEFSVFVSDSKINLLYLEGTLRWEYKFFKRFLEQDPQLEPTFVILTGGSNISIQGNTKIKLDGGLPGPLEELAKFDAIIIGDVPKDFFGDAALARLEKYVSEKGGGVLFMSGFHTMQSGEYKRTPMENLIPVEIKTLKSRPPATPATLSITAMGRSHDVLVGLETLINGRKVSNAYTTGRAKPGALTLVEQQLSGGLREPLLVAETYGAGRTMLLAADRLYEWDFGAGSAASKTSKGLAGQSGAQRLWGQMTLWLSRQDIKGEENGPLVSTYTDQTYYEPGEMVSVNVRPNDRAVGDAKLSINVSIFSGDRKVADVPISSAGGNPLLRGSLRPPGEGFYRAQVSATAGKKQTKVDLKFSVGAPIKEMEVTRLDEDMLRGLAQQTNGGYYTLVKADEILDRIRGQEARVEQRKEIPLINSGICFGLFIVITFVEWTLRRKQQLI